MFGINNAPILCQDKHYLRIDWNELPREPRQLGVPSGASKIISNPMVWLVQTVHLSCSNTNTVMDRTETRFHMSHITLEFHQLRPKQFPSQCYVLHKQYTYLAPTLTLSPNGPKQDLPWPTSPRSSIGCVQNDFWGYGTFSVNNAPILRQDKHYVQMDRNELSL
jgi:hypothetical protein